MIDKIIIGEKLWKKAKNEKMVLGKDLAKILSEQADTNNKWRLNNFFWLKEKEIKESTEKIKEATLEILLLAGHVDWMDKDEKLVINNFCKKHNIDINKIEKFEEKEKFRKLNLHEQVVKSYNNNPNLQEQVIEFLNSTDLNENKENIREDINEDIKRFLKSIIESLLKDSKDIINKMTVEDKRELFKWVVKIVLADGKISRIEYIFVEVLSELLGMKTLIMEIFDELDRTLKLSNENEKLIRELKAKNEDLKQQKEEVTAQRNEIELQKETVERKNIEITNSINYAKKIQRAVLPSPEQRENLLPKSFIFFEPKDIVSWDFPRIFQDKENGKIHIAVADCTWHWVPWAMMSMLWTEFLSDIVWSQHHLKANEILDELRYRVKESLEQTWKIWEQQDWMDITFCTLDPNTNKLEFAWANNSLYLVRDNELIEYKADKMPIWIHPKDKTPFTNNEIQLRKWDMIYFSSDWYKDQFWWPNMKKFMSKRFEGLLQDISGKEITEQEAIIKETFNNWKWNEIQVDDVTVMWIRI